MNKRISATEAARLVKSGDTVASVGVIGWVTPDALLRGVADRFRRESEPRDLTFYFPCGTGDSIDIRGMDHVAIEGLMKRIISGSYVNPLHPTRRTRPELMRLIRENRIEAYSWPIGASMQWLREVARKGPGLLTEIGLGTYADPRQQGGKFTSLARQDLIELIEFRGKPYLFYPAFPLNVGFIRASSADSAGNLSYEDETLISSNVALALAVKASGGIVIAQVRHEVPRYSRPAHHVRIPAALVDHYVVEAEQMSGTDIRSDRAYLGGSAPDLRSLPRLPLGPDKIIARRASCEVRPGRTSIFGFGASSDVPLVMAEAGLFDGGRIDDYQFTTEHGPFGGIVMSGWQFSANIGPEALLDGVQQLDFIDGGNCPFAALAFAQFDREGNVNVSRFGSSNPGRRRIHRHRAERQGPGLHRNLHHLRPRRRHWRRRAADRQGGRGAEIRRSRRADHLSGEKGRRRARPDRADRDRARRFPGHGGGIDAGRSGQGDRRPAGHSRPDGVCAGPHRRSAAFDGRLAVCGVRTRPRIEARRHGDIWDRPDHGRTPSNQRAGSAPCPALLDCRSELRLDCDVLVVGGGAAGVAAAVVAARRGARVVLVERYGFCGGGAVAGLSGTVCGMYAATDDASAPPRQMVHGFLDEFVAAHGAARRPGAASALRQDIHPRARSAWSGGKRPMRYWRKPGSRCCCTPPYSARWSKAAKKSKGSSPTPRRGASRSRPGSPSTPAATPTSSPWPAFRPSSGRTGMCRIRP